MRTRTAHGRAAYSHWTDRTAAYESLGDIAMAIKHLEAYLEVSQLMGDMGAQVRRRSHAACARSSARGR